MRDFKNIKAWQFADNLAVLTYVKTKSFPREELYGLTSQLRRAAVSVPTNIVEGASRGHKREYLHFLYVARGSLSEVNYLSYLADRLNYLGAGDYKEFEDLTSETAKVLHGLIVSVKKETNFIQRFSAIVTSGLVLYGLKLFS